MAASSADRKADRSLGEKGFGPDVISPKERRCSITLRVASAEIQERLAMQGRDDWEIFGEIRERKNRG